MTLLNRGRLITLLGLASLAGVYVRALAFTPTERLQGAAQKIYYLHVPAAIWTETAMILVGVAGALFPFPHPARPSPFPAAPPGRRPRVAAPRLPPRPPSVLRPSGRSG